MEGGLNSELPPGFRFHPTDEELIIHYLCNQAASKTCPASIIPEVDIYKFDPWELPEKTEFGEKEWYFFSPRDRKYPNGVRPNRVTVSGYWKATGSDKAIYSGSKHVGMKKALVFYNGRPPKGVKTDWIMHEYTLAGSRRQVNWQIGSMRLDDCVLCRIYRKKQMGKALEQKEDDSTAKINIAAAEVDNDEKMMKFPMTFSSNHVFDVDYMGPISELLYDGSYNSTLDFQNNTANAGIDQFVNKPHQLVEMPDHYAANSGKFQVKPRSSNQPIFVNQLYDMCQNNQ